MNKHKTCIHAIHSGEIAVYVKSGCKRASMIKGVLVSSKKRCQECKSWRGSE